MDAVSICDERCVISEINQRTAEGPALSEIPKVSLCPPDSEDAESPMTDVLIEGDQINHLSISPSSSQLYDQVLQSQAYQSPRLKRCLCCDHQQPIRDNVCLNQTTASSHSDCTSSVTKRVHRCSPFHQPICQNTLQCHWLQGSRDGSNYKPVQHHVVTVRTERLRYQIPKNYSQIIVEYPMTVFISCAVVLLAFSLAGILIGPLPDFSDPLAGYEPHGTDIGIRLAAWAKLQESTGPGKELSLTSQQFKDQRITRDHGASRQISGKSQHHLKQRSRRMLHMDTTENNYFCNDPADHYAQLVFRSENSDSLWSLKAIYSMCEMEQSQIRSDAHFKELCQVQSESFGTKGKEECCPSWSLGNVLALLNNVSSCFSLTAQQVSDSLALLRYCAPYYHDGRLIASCAERNKYGVCAAVPHPCRHSGIIYLILHYLVDKDFLGPQTVNYQVPSLKYSLVFLPMAKGNALMEIYLNRLEGHELTYNNTTITGMDLGIKQKLFKYYLSRDAVYPILTVLVLLLTMALYLRSFLLSSMSLVAVTLSLLTSYFFYKVVFGLLFFPLLNLMAVLVLLGSCSNQAFTFTDFWKSQLRHDPPAALEKRIHCVLQEMGYLILVSGLTSSITFYSGCISSITVVRCFAVYLGSASLINTLFALVWLPCAIVLQERYAAGASASASKPSWKSCCSKYPGGFWDTSSRKRCLFTMGQKFRVLKRGLSDTSNLIFLKVLPCGVVKFRYIWICWFAVLAAGGIYISCVDPGMKLPSSDSKATQLFRSSHPFERYDAEYRNQFMFERMKQGEDRPMTMTLIWGVTPTDNKNNHRFVPPTNGSFTIDPEFNISSSEAQVWLRKLCGTIRNQSFYSPSPADQEAAEDNTCFVEDLIHWVSVRRCSENEDAVRFCCNNISFPYPSSVFERCLKMMVEEQQAEAVSPRNGGPRFDSQNRIAALVVVFKTSQLYSFNFSRTSNFYKQVTSWFNAEISSAPPGLQKGWFVSQLLLYDLQQCLSSETLVVAGFSIALTFASLLLTTLNIPLSIYVTFAVGGSVFVTVGLLVLLEWQLNSVEALFILASTGLSVDFSVNYCISYCLAPHTDRLGRVAYSLRKMGSPVATGAGAYFCVGIIMLPATALLLRKIGIFLLLVKCVSCGFATFFFQSLCCFFGPEKNCGKIIMPCAKERTTESIPPSCSGADVGNNNLSANGTFGCSTRSQGMRHCNKEGGGTFLCPNQHRHRQHQSRVGREPEQYELQPLACHLSDSFENSTCTSKLSNRPSVLSDDIEFCGLSPKRYYDRISTESMSDEICNRHLKSCDTHQAIQTSSPYKGNKKQPVAVPPCDPAKEKRLCKKCHTGPDINLWNLSLSSSSMEEITVTETTGNIHKRSISMDGSYKCHEREGFLSRQSQNSVEGLEDSNETCLSDIEPPVSAAPHTVTEEELQPGHLNGKRDTLRLSLRDTVYDPGSPGSGRGRTSQCELPVILPNSQPDLPDVWIKRDGGGNDSS